MRWLLAFALILLPATPLAAQLGVNRGDTLRFVQVAKTTGEMQTPMGPQQMSVNMRTRYSLTALGGDSAATWVDSLVIDPPMPTLGAPMDALRGRRMILHFLPDGRVRFGDGQGAGLAVPGLAQMTPSMWGFVLPKRGDLRRGAMWVDTMAMRIDTMGTSMSFTNITRFEVVGDSTFEGMPVTVLSTISNSNVTATGTIGVTGKGEGSGRAYYSRALGIIVHLTGFLQMNQDMQIETMTMQVRNRVDTTLSLVRR
ncbi:MAG: hypothetical protein ACREMA_10430 [Longimicrobiales bacterium]